MRKHRLMVFGIAFLLLPFADCLLQEAQAAAISGIADGTESTPPVPAQEQPEVLTRGPVHEAFAEPVTLQADEGLVTVKQPPVVISEILPAEKPVGANLVWVPGYWSWDGDRDNYIWVSGCWRTAPPKMSWVPGYWTRVSVGWKWVSGFWMQSGNNEIVYLKEPPAPVEIEPAGPPPTEYSIWVPGCWYWTNGRYVLRSGYWLQGQAGWVWTPSHYVWTPRGYVFTSGHWDYSIERRGVLYAPVYFPSSVVYTRPGYRYSLGITVDLGLLNVNLFCYPRYSHYYFGDYYDDAFIRVGIFPCFESVRRHIWYDPIYQYDRWHSKDPRWDEHARHDYEARRSDRDLRPPRNYHEQESRMSKIPENQRDKFQIVRSGNSVSQSKSTSRKFEQADNDTRQKFTKQSNDVQNYREERRQWESTEMNSKGAGTSGERSKAEGSRNYQAAESRGDSTGQQDRGKDSVYKGSQKSADVNGSSRQYDQSKDAGSRGSQTSMQRSTDNGSRNDRSSADRGDSAGQTEQGKSYSRGTQSSDDRNDSAGRSERVRIPDSPVADRYSSTTNGDRYPSTPSEERRSGQDWGRDSSRGDSGQRGGGNRGGR